MKLFSIIGYLSPWIVLLLVLWNGWLPIILKLSIIWMLLNALFIGNPIAFVIGIFIGGISYFFSDNLFLQIIIVVLYILMWINRTQEMLYYENIGYKNMGIRIGIHMMINIFIVIITYFIANFFNLL